MAGGAIAGPDPAAAAARLRCVNSPAISQPGYAAPRICPGPDGKALMDMDTLKLIALDAEDIAVISAHLQDAVLKVADMAFLPREKRFAALLNRFDWAGALASESSEPARRRQSALRFERVLGAAVSGIDLKAGQEVLSLLAIDVSMLSPDDPQGHVTLLFAGGGAVRLHVECVEAELKDLGPAWAARAVPRHPDDDRP